MPRPMARVGAVNVLALALLLNQATAHTFLGRELQATAEQELSPRQCRRWLAQPLLLTFAKRQGATRQVQLRACRSTCVATLGML